MKTASTGIITKEEIRIPEVKVEYGTVTKKFPETQNPAQRDFVPDWGFSPEFIFRPPKVDPV
ncbi:MAG TPA: hypothetical protein VLT51_06190 [Anaerolineales bacterium]|nr:hypothetical protein [Anaerolineales bacterium]